MVVDTEVVENDVDETTDRVFHALSDPTRRDIVARAMLGDHSVTGLAGSYPMSFAAVQKHVSILERAGLVTKERRGRETLVRTDIRAVRHAAGVLDAFEATWRARLERFAEVLTDVAAGSTITPTTDTTGATT